MSQILKFLPHKHENLSLIPRIHIFKKAATYIYNRRCWEAEAGGSLGLSDWPNWTKSNSIKKWSGNAIFRCILNICLYAHRQVWSSCLIKETPICSKDHYRKSQATVNCGSQSQPRDPQHISLPYGWGRGHCRRGISSKSQRSRESVVKLCLLGISEVVPTNSHQ